MATWFITDKGLGVPAIEDNDTTARVPLGTIVRARSDTYGEGEFIYLLGVANTTIGNTVTYAPSTFQTALSPNTANLGQPIAVAMSANVALSYGWYQIGGVATVKKTAVRVSPDVALFQSATTGRVMNTTASGKQVLGARSANTATVLSATSTILVNMNRPHMQGRTV